MTRRRRTPEAREAARQRWRALSPDARAERRARSWATFSEHYPERAAAYSQVHAAIASGTLTPAPCEICGGVARPILDRTTNELAGWRCLACRKKPSKVAT